MEKSLAFFFVVVICTFMAIPAVGQHCAPSCEDVTVSGTKVMNPSNCLQYYTCTDVGGPGMQLSDPVSCPEGSYFDKYLVIPDCDPIADAPPGYCDDYCNPCLPYCVTPSTLIPEPTNCNEYHLCLDNGDTLNQNCPVGQLWDYIGTECGVDPEKCFSYCDLCEPYCVEPGLIPDPRDCQSYYVCDPPTNSHFTCSDAQHFDANTMACEAGSCGPTICIS